MAHLLWAVDWFGAVLVAAGCVSLSAVGSVFAFKCVKWIAEAE